MYHKKQGLGAHVGFGTVEITIVYMLADTPGVFYFVEFIAVLVNCSTCYMHQVIVVGEVIIEPLLPGLLGNKHLFFGEEKS